MPEPTEKTTEEILAEHVRSGGNVDGSEHTEPHPGSGMLASMKGFMNNSADKNNDKLFADEISERLVDFNTDKKKTIAEFVESKDVTKIESFSEAEKNKVKEVFPNLFVSKDDNNTPPKEDFGVKLEEMEKPALIDEFKKSQRLVADRENEITSLKAKVIESEGTVEELKKSSKSEADSVLEEMKVDFLGTYNKYAKKYNLPPLDMIAQQLSGGDTEDRIRQYQDTHLRSYIEKKYNLQEGEFEYDPKEAAIAKTPSAEWDLLTAKKRQELSEESSNIQKVERERLTKVEEQQRNDLKWLTDTYYDGDSKKAEEAIKEMDGAVAKISKGEEPYEKHPFAMRNLVRGFYFEQLRDEAVQAAVDNLTAEFAKHKMYLPGKDSPTDISNISSNNSNTIPLHLQKDIIQHSPMLQNIAGIFNK